MQSQPQITRVLPRWVVILGSVCIGWHFFALGIGVLASPSGPWPTPFGFADTAAEPQFAKKIGDLGPGLRGFGAAFSIREYLNLLHMSHNYHFSSNRPEIPQVKFEVRIKDKAGKVIDTIEFPQKDANFWVRHRQTLLAQALGDDQPVQTQQSRRIAPRGKKLPDVTFWFGEPGREGKLVTKSENELPNDPMLTRPSDWSLVVAKGYLRYLERQYPEANSLELVRLSKNQIVPAVLFMNDLPEGTLETLTSNFEDPRRVK